MEIKSGRVEAHWKAALGVASAGCGLLWPLTFKTLRRWAGAAAAGWGSAERRGYKGLNGVRGAGKGGGREPGGAGVRGTRAERREGREECCPATVGPSQDAFYSQFSSIPIKTSESRKKRDTPQRTAPGGIC